MTLVFSIISTYIKARAGSLGATQCIVEPEKVHYPSPLRIEVNLEI